MPDWLRPFKAVGVVLVAAWVLSACLSDNGQPNAAARFYGVDITRAHYAQDWSMPDVYGQQRSRADFAGKVVFVFFGFAQCPDVCPTTLLELSEAKRLLGADGERVQTVFVTVDPERDTPEVVRAYLASFDDTAVGLVGSAEQLKAMAKDFKVVYEKVPQAGESGSYTLNHSAAGFVFDPQGRLRLYMRYGTPVNELVADLQQLLAGQ